MAVAQCLVDDRELRDRRIVRRRAVARHLDDRVDARQPDDVEPGREGAVVRRVDAREPALVRHEAVRDQRLCAAHVRLIFCDRYDGSDRLPAPELTHEREALDVVVAFEYEALRNLPEGRQQRAAIQSAGARCEIDERLRIPRLDGADTLARLQRDFRHAGIRALMLMDRTDAGEAKFCVKRFPRERRMQHGDAIAQRFEQQLHQLAPDTASMTIGRDDHHAEGAAVRAVLPVERRADNAITFLRDEACARIEHEAPVVAAMRPCQLDRQGVRRVDVMVGKRWL